MFCRVAWNTGTSKLNQSPPLLNTSIQQLPWHCFHYPLGFRKGKLKSMQMNMRIKKKVTYLAHLCLFFETRHSKPFKDPIPMFLKDKASGGKR